MTKIKKVAGIVRKFDKMLDRIPAITEHDKSEVGGLLAGAFIVKNIVPLVLGGTIVASGLKLIFDICNETEEEADARGEKKVERREQRQEKIEKAIAEIKKEAEEVNLQKSEREAARAEKEARAEQQKAEVAQAKADEAKRKADEAKAKAAQAEADRKKKEAEKAKKEAQKAQKEQQKIEAKAKSDEKKRAEKEAKKTQETAKKAEPTQVQKTEPKKAPKQEPKRKESKKEVEEQRKDDEETKVSIGEVLKGAARTAKAKADAKIKEVEAEVAQRKADAARARAERDKRRAAEAEAKAKAAEERQKKESAEAKAEAERIRLKEEAMKNLETADLTILTESEIATTTLGIGDVLKDVATEKPIIDITMEDMLRTDHTGDNTPNDIERQRLQITINCVNFIQRKLGLRLRVSSGFRSPAINTAVGGSDTSAHMLGYAADLKPLDVSVEDAFVKIAKFLKENNYKWDQLIYEHYSTLWIHLGLFNNQGQQRRQIFPLGKEKKLPEGARNIKVKETKVSITEGNNKRDNGKSTNNKQ